MATISGDLSTGLVSVWEMESGALTTDSHGTNTLTDNNTVGSGTGVQGGCGDFERDNSEYLSIAEGSQTGLDFTSAFSVSLWVKLEADLANGTEYSVVGKGDFSNNNRAYLCTTYKVSGTSYFRIYMSSNGTDGGQASAQWTSSTAVTTGSWFHIVWSWSGANDRARVYVNGSQQGSDSNALPSSCFNSNSSFYIAHHPVFGNYIDGLIDQVAVWSSELTAANVSTLYNSGSGIAYAAAASGPAKLKTRDTIAKASVKTIDGIAIASVKTIDTIGS